MTREPAPRPKRYRPAIPAAIKVAVTVHQEGKCSCGCGGKLDALREGVEFDHRPPLEIRDWDGWREDTTPPANDPTYIFAMRKPCHRRKTDGSGTATTKGSDAHDRKRRRNLQAGQAEHSAKMAAKAGLIPTPDNDVAAITPESFKPYAPALEAIAREAQSPAFRKIEAGLQEALAFARGDPEAVASARVTTVRVPAHPPAQKRRVAKLKGRGFQTNRDGPYKARIGGGVERRSGDDARSRSARRFDNEKKDQDE